ncbi:MAG: serine/threonine protein phosphatase [Acidobacteria bacterium]|nr:MAG: serine/threonine protein phosphatase [Acidobacteriota bacterium]
MAGRHPRRVMVRGRRYLWRSRWLVAPRATLPGRALFAVGDVHGRADLLGPLLEVLRRRIRETGGEATVVHLGDYVDRGPRSDRVLDLVAAGLGEPRADEVALLGNHDAILVEILRHTEPEPDLIDAWMRMNAVPTLLALGLSEEDVGVPPAAFRERLAAALGTRRLAFLRGLRLMHRVGGYLFVHAGIDPAADIASLDPLTLLTIREPFLSGSASWIHPFVVVHGHTPMQPAVLPHRIGVDTGAAFTGALTAAEIRENRVRFLTVTDGPGPEWRDPLPGDPEAVSYEPPVPLGSG